MDQHVSFGDPDAPIPGGHDRSDVASTQALLRRQRRHLDIAEPVQAGGRGDPQAPLPVLEDVVHRVARQPVGTGEPLRPPLCDPHQPVPQRTDPQAAPAIGEHRLSFQLEVRRAGMARPTARHQPPDPLGSGPRPQGAAGVVGEGEDSVLAHHLGQAPERVALRALRRLRLPPADTAIPSEPDVALPVLMQSPDIAEPELGREPETPEVPAHRTAEGRKLRRPRVSRPDRAPTVFEESAEAPLPRMDHEVRGAPLRQSVGGADPEAPVAGCQEFEDPIARKTRSLRRLPGHEPHAVETDQTGLGSNPQESVACLGDRGRRPGEVPVPNAPRGVTVLGEGGAGVEADGGVGEQQQGNERSADNRSARPTTLAATARLSPLAPHDCSRLTRWWYAGPRPPVVAQNYSIS